MKIIALDLDGTLLTYDKKLTDKTRSVLTKVAEQGNWIVPATGRALRAIPAEILSLPFLRYVISINGASVSDEVTGERLLCGEEDTAAIHQFPAIALPGGERIAQCDIGALQVRSVANKVVREEVLCTLTCESEFNGFWEGVRKGTIGVQTRGTDGSIVRQVVIINVVADGSMECNLEKKITQFFCQMLRISFVDRIHNFP